MPHTDGVARFDSGNITQPGEIKLTMYQDLVPEAGGDAFWGLPAVRAAESCRDYATRPSEVRRTSQTALVVALTC
jgi:hypothetical protein